MKKLKVLMVDYALPRNKYAHGLCTELCKKVELQVACDSRKEVGFEPTYTVIPMLYNGGKNKYGALFAYFLSNFKLAAMVVTGRYDVLHVQTFKKPSYEIALYKKLHPFVGKMVHTVHNVLPHEEKDENHKLYKSFYDACDELIVHNEYSKQLLIDVFDINSDKITIAAHGVYSTHVASDIEKSDREKFTVLLFGKVRKYKGIDVLIKSVQYLSEEAKKKIRIIIAGEQFKDLDDTDYEALIQECKAESIIEFRNRRISDQEKAQLFTEADVCVCPYRVIFGSGVLLESYTYKCPVIVSDVPVFCEETDNGKTGLIFKNEDPKDLAEKLERMVWMNSEERKEFITNIHSLVETKYNWKSSAQKTLQAYQKNKRYLSEN